MTAGHRFLAWTRQGLAAALPSGSSGAAGGRAVLPVTLSVLRNDAPQTASVDLRLYGPGDVVGIDGRQVIRTDPAPLTTQFEPNYFPAIEFDLPDYPWLFSPEASSPRLRPWIVLAVVRRDVADVRFDPARPLPWLEIDAGAALGELPPLADSWAWAHAQLAGTEADPRTALAGPPERTLSRLVCPRRLEPGIAYVACVVPAYEAGRQAGLGLEVTAGGQDAWPPFAPGASGRFELPVYHHWEFSTGPEGDFEALARRLDPVAFGPEIGTRPMDVTTAGWQLPVPAPGEPGATLGMEGALMSPVAEPTEWPVEARTPFQARLLELVTEGGTEQLVVAPPLHGAHAAAPVPPPPGAGEEEAGWLWGLNLDPRHRAAAGLGAQVVADQQEQLVAAAWDQAGDLDRANALLRRAQLARSVAAATQEKRLAPLAADAVLRLTQPLHSRVRVERDGGHGAGTVRTLRGSVRASVFPEAAVSAPFRRAVRPRGPLGRHLPGGDEVGALTRDLAEGAVTVPLKPAKGAVAFDRVGEPELAHAKARVPHAPGWTRVYGGDAPVYPGAAPPESVPPPGEADGARTAGDGGETPPPGAARRPEENGGDGEPPPPEPRRRRQRLGNINTRFRDASEALFELIPQVPGEPLTQPVATAAAADETLALGAVAGTLHDPEGPLAPDRTVPQQVLSLIPEAGMPAVPAPGDQPADPLRPRAAAPRFPQPMSEPLRAISQDALLPGAERIEPDTAGLLLGNARFIEAYMVGVNHALADELRWRDLPTDYGATYFRQFWDPRGAGSGAGPDVDPIGDWAPERPLGANATRVGGRGMLVLLVRGELFRRYPHTIVYAVRADTLDGQPVERYPEFRGRLDPDMTFLGFGLGLDEARGADGGPGWYFVLQEQPTAPRFGFDALHGEGGDGRFGGTPATWADLHWGMLAATRAEYDLLRHAPAGGRLAGTARPLFAPAQGAPVATWGADAAQTAAIAFQRPVRVAIHASTMLSEAGPDPALRVTEVEREGGEVVALAGVDAAGRRWRRTRAEVVDAIARGAESFVAAGRDGEQPRVVVLGDGAQARLATSSGEPLEGEG